MLHVTEVTATRDLSEYREPWERLASASAHAGLFETPTWITAWLATYWKDRPIAFLFVHDDDELVGLAPLLHDVDGELGCKGALVTPVNPHVRRSDILYTGEPDPVIGSVIAHLAQAHERTPMRIRSADAASPSLPALRKYGGHLLLQEQKPSPIIRISGTWAEYLASRPRHLRQELGRKKKKLEAAWQVDWATVSSAPDYERALTDIMRIERNSWKEREGTSFGAEPGAAELYARVARGYAASGQLRLQLLYLDGNPVAHVYGVIYENAYYARKTSYDDAYRAWSPGNVLFNYVLEQAFSEGLATFDFLGSDARWKSEIANATREHVDACVFPANALLCRWCEAREQHIKPFLREQAPALIALKKALTAETPSKG
jgi:hypothetical protein